MSEWAIIHDGPWGDALARRLAAADQQVHLVGDKASRKRRPKNITYGTDPEAALAVAERVILADSIDGIEARLVQIRPFLQGNHRVLTCARGLTPTAHERASAGVLRLTAVRQVAVLAGAVTPTQLSKGKAGALVIGSAFPSWSAELQAVLMGEQLRVYTNLDAVGVEIANAVATVLCVALGAARQLGVGPSISATALTRGAAEMDRVVTALGGQAGTAFGLAGVGVLAEATLSGVGEAFEAGMTLGRGEAADDLTELADLAARLAARAGALKLRAPMVQAVAALFGGQLPAAQMFKMLMTRSARAE